MQRGGWVYLMSNRRDGTLYLGVTSNLSRRAWEHRESLIGGFTKQYGLKRLVWYEWHDDIRVAIQRERSDVRSDDPGHGASFQSNRFARFFFTVSAT